MTEQDKSKELEVAQKKAVEPTSGEPTRQGVMYVPYVDILESQDAILLRADVPGALKDQVTIDVREGVLTLTAGVRTPEAGWRPVYKEYEVGGFIRRFTLGEQINQDKINAKLENGVLLVTLPKAEQAKPRKITVA